MNMNDIVSRGIQATEQQAPIDVVLLDKLTGVHKPDHAEEYPLEAVSKAKHEALIIVGASSDKPITLYQDVQAVQPATLVATTSHEARIERQDHVFQQINKLKFRNKSTLDEVARIQTGANKHLTECQDHLLQITQLRFIFGTGNHVIIIGSDNTISSCNAEKIALASKLLEHGINRAKSLGAFYTTQKKYFGLLEIMKKIEFEIQGLLVESAASAQDTELLESEDQVAMLEDSRVHMVETWLEWLEELG